MRITLVKANIFQGAWNGRLFRRLGNEGGSILIVSLLVLVVLAMLGAIASNMSITEIQASANERRYQQTFYAADSGWQEVMALLDLEILPPIADTSGTPPTYAVTLDDQTPNVIDDISYSFGVTQTGNVAAVGSGPNYRKFSYAVTSSADNRQQINTALSKVYKIGY